MRAPGTTGEEDERAGAADARERGPAPPDTERSSDRLRALQRAAGNRAFGRLARQSLTHGPRSEDDIRLLIARTVRALSQHENSDRLSESRMVTSAGPPASLRSSLQGTAEWYIGALRLASDEQLAAWHIERAELRPARARLDAAMALWQQVVRGPANATPAQLAQTPLAQRAGLTEQDLSRMVAVRELYRAMENGLRSWTPPPDVDAEHRRARFVRSPEFEAIARGPLATAAGIPIGTLRASVGLPAWTEDQYGWGRLALERMSGADGRSFGERLNAAAAAGGGIALGGARIGAEIRRDLRDPRLAGADDLTLFARAARRHNPNAQYQRDAEQHFRHLAHIPPLGQCSHHHLPMHTRPPADMPAEYRLPGELWPDDDELLPDLRGSEASAPSLRIPALPMAPQGTTLARRRVLARDDVDRLRPSGVTALPNALPRGAHGAEGATVVADAALPGGWTDAAQPRLSSGRVGGIQRILLDDLGAGLDHEQQPLRHPTRRQQLEWSNLANATSPTQRARAVALIPESVRALPAGRVTVIVHFHGLGTGVRQRGADPSDVHWYRMEQQLEAFLATPGNESMRVIVLMPVGRSVGQNAAGNNFNDTDFGNLDVNALISECFTRLTHDGVLPANSTAGRVYLSAHSGGGLEISRMLRERGRPRLPSGFAGVFAFEAFHGDTGDYSALAIQQLNEALRELTARAGAPADQLRYLRDEGFRFVAFGGLEQVDRVTHERSGYGVRVRAIRQAILDWFSSHAAQLRRVTGGDADVLNQLWRNFQANWFAGSNHRNALAGPANNFGRALGTLPGAHEPPPPPPTARPQRRRAGARTVTRRPVGTESHFGHPPPFDSPAGDEPEWMQWAAAHPPTADTVPAAPPPAPAPAPAPATATPPAFPREHYSISNRVIPSLGVPASRVCNEVLRHAGAPADWYDNFTSGVTFLGQRVAQPIHIRLARHLWSVEQAFAARFGDAAAAGRALGVTEAIVGSRDFPTSADVSMHMFGLAIDVNYTSNPYIAQGEHGPDRINAVFRRMNVLMGARRTYRHGLSYDELSELNATLLAYFALADDARALQARLDAATGAPWRGMDATRARTQILDDRAYLSREWASRTHGPQREAAIRQTGFLNLSRDLVQGMGLSWGGTEYSDMMHFDMRNDGGIGTEIQRAVRWWKREHAAGRPTTG